MANLRNETRTMLNNCDCDCDCGPRPQPPFPAPVIPMSVFEEMMYRVACNAGYIGSKTDFRDDLANSLNGVSQDNLCLLVMRGSYQDFPDVGQNNYLYIDTDASQLYYWIDGEGYYRVKGEGGGGGTSTLGDEKTISLTDGVLGLKNWGVEYYKWDTENGSHVLQVVDENNPWVAGLEPKATTMTDGSIEIAWYEPSTTTIEDVGPLVQSLQTSVNNLSAAVGSADDTAEEETVYGEIAQVRSEMLPLAGGAMTGTLTLMDGSPAASEAIVDTKIASAISSAGHLKREIVDALPEVASADSDTIYMVKKADKDEYEEYVLITVGGTKRFEKIGDTAVDLTPYMKKAEGAVEGNIAIFNTNGEIVDGTFNAESFVSATDETYLGLVNNAEKLENLPVFSSFGNGLLVSDSGEVSVKVVEENGLSISENGIALGLASAESAGAMSAAHYEKLEAVSVDAQINVVEGALIGTMAATIDENKNIVIPVAATELGVVKSSDADNCVSVAEDGTMSINRISIMKLFNEEGSELILYGGVAK